MHDYTLNLEGCWFFKEYDPAGNFKTNLKSENWHEAEVPGSIYSQLIQTQQIQQQEIETHPDKFNWIAEKEWIYRKNFDVSEDILNRDRVDLVFEGLDTIATIWLNGKKIAQTNNMLIGHRFDVSDVIKAKANVLVVRFESALNHGKKLVKKHGNATLQNGRVFMRKAQYQFGWDWCPGLPGCGIWRPVRLEGVEKARIENLYIRTAAINDDYATIETTVTLDKVVDESYTCCLSITGGQQQIDQQLKFSSGQTVQSAQIKIDNPQLWWPIGYGPQNLYQVAVHLKNNDQTIDKQQEQFGLREVKLNCEPDENGHKFQFEINGQPVYARGANWIPDAMFAGTTTAQDYQQLTQMAVDCNINMLRVWGGGYYEAKEFYRLCDKLGIMVWQDFMFACAYYPDVKWFLEQVKNEASIIVKQLRNHPCRVIWCGNNEIDWIHHNKWFGNARRFYGKKIYHDILPAVVAQFDPDHKYIPTTPVATNGNPDPNDPDSGAVHQWNVWNFNAPTRDFVMAGDKVPRFTTEFGLQAIPAVNTIKKFCPPDDRRIGSWTLEKHNYQEDNSRI